MVAILEARGLTKSFGNLKALDSVDLSVEKSSVTILIGPNGSGKTTFINTVAGFYKPDSGSVLYEGRDVTSLPPHKMCRLGVVRTFQIPTLFWKLSVLENILVAQKDNPGEGFLKSLSRRSWLTREREATESAFRILQIVGLHDLWDRPSTTLSGGQMKLLEIGRALMSDAKLLLLDEPISGVNPTLAREIFDRIVRLRDELGVTFFIVEHRLDIALEYVDDAIAMAFGKVVASGRASDVMVNKNVVEAYLGG